MLGPNGDTRRKLETENECRIILKEPPDAVISHYINSLYVYV